MAFLMPHGTRVHPELERLWSGAVPLGLGVPISPGWGSGFDGEIMAQCVALAPPPMTLCPQGLVSVFPWAWPLGLHGAIILSVTQQMGGEHDEATQRQALPR